MSMFQDGRTNEGRVKFHRELGLRDRKRSCAQQESDCFAALADVVPL